MTLVSLSLLITVGLIGCLCNILIFTSRQLKSNSCAVYFLSTAVIEFGILCFGGISRLATEHFGSVLINQNRLFCKIRAYINTSMSTISMYLILLTAVDRCMATSFYTHHRAFSQITVARRMVMATITFLMLLNIPNLIYFDLYPSCLPRPGVYSFIYSLYLIINTGLLPDGLILVFTLITLQHVKNIRLRISQRAFIDNAQKRRLHRMETHLVLMMLAQGSVSILFDLTRVSCYTYYFVTVTLPKTPYGKMLGLFIFQLSNVLFYLNASKSFYIYTLASSYFRRVFAEIIRSYYRRLCSSLHLRDHDHCQPVQFSRTMGKDMISNFHLQPMITL